MRIKLIFILFTIIPVSSFAQIGTHIDSSRLPPLQDAWWDSITSIEQVYPWQNAGCLDSLQAEGGFVRILLTIHPGLLDSEGWMIKNCMLKLSES